MHPQYARKPSFVEAVQVTAENMPEVANWCSGQIVLPEGKLGVTTAEDYAKGHIKVKVFRPQNERQTKAFVGDWVLRVRKESFKVYTNEAFERSYDSTEVIEDAGTPLYDQILTELKAAHYATPHPPVAETAGKIYRWFQASREGRGELVPQEQTQAMDFTNA